MRKCEIEDCWRTAAAVYRPVTAGPGRAGVALCDLHASELRSRARRDLVRIPEEAPDA